MDGITEFAKLFKDRENVSFMGAQIGKIVNILPDIKISLGERIILDKDDLILIETITNKNLFPGDEVLLLPTSDEQVFFLIDKVVRL